MSQMNPESAPAENAVAMEKRGSARRSITDSATLSLVVKDVKGAGKDLSSTGAYFVTGEALNIEVKWDSQEGSTKTGRIVRVDRLTQDSVGIAIEFDSKATASER